MGKKEIYFKVGDICACLNIDRTKSVERNTKYWRKMGEFIGQVLREGSMD